MARIEMDFAVVGLHVDLVAVEHFGSLGKGRINEFAEQGCSPILPKMRQERV
jgi:hypothetical protein